MPTERRTKIVCTLGPATENDDILRELIKSGMSVARLNFSHGSHEYHGTNIERTRRIADGLGAHVAVMVDTKGPEIRTGMIADHQPINLNTGDHVVVTTRAVDTAPGLIAIDYAALPQEVEPGSTIFIDDGLVRLVVDHVEGTEIHCVADNSGKIAEHKGVNVPGVLLALPSVTEQDERDIRFACEMGADAVAVSFVRDADAVRKVRAICEDAGCPHMMIISKIECALALDNLDEIIEESDGIMVARGDLGVEIPPSKVPSIQKKIIYKCNEMCKPVITATQMLESMTHHPRPTRAEVTDVANAVFDGTDCVMLSGETAAGEYPVEAVRMMAEVCVDAEKSMPAYRLTVEPIERMSVENAANEGAVAMAECVGATAIICATESGRSARIMAARRPSLPIIAVTPAEHSLHKTCFFWGVTGVLTEVQDGIARICYNALKAVRQAKLVQRDDIVVVTAGDPVTSPLTENSKTVTNFCVVAQIF